MKLFSFSAEQSCGRGQPESQTPGEDAGSSHDAVNHLIPAASEPDTIRADDIMECVGVANSPG